MCEFALTQLPRNQNQVLADDIHDQLRYRKSLPFVADLSTKRGREEDNHRPVAVFLELRKQT